MDANAYFKHIIDTAIRFNVELHSVAINYDYISITTTNSVGMRVELGKPNDRISDNGVMEAIEYIISCAAPIDAGRAE